MKRSLYGVAVLLCAMVTALGNAPLHAQAVTTAAISGRVVSQQGAGLAGVQITATNTATGGASRVITRSDGRYLLPGLQPGSYQISASALGYGTQTRTAVTLTLGQTANFDFTLSTQAVALDELTVVSERNAVISQGRTGASAVVSDSTLRRAPTITRDLQDFTRLVPQLAVTNTTTGAVSGGGRNNRFNQLQIDGTASNDLFGLSASGSPGGQAGAKAITMEAIQELQIVLAPFDVRQNGFTGASVNAVTRSGTNRFQGSVAGFNRNENLVGRYTVRNPAGDTLSAPFGQFNNTEVAGSFGGPIVRNRAFFFGAGEVTRRSNPIDFVGGTDPTRGITLDQAEAVRAHLESLGYDAGTTGARTLERNSTNLFGRFDFNLGQDHRLTVRHNYIDGAREDFSRGPNAYSLGNAGYTQNSTTNSSVLQLNSGFGGGLFNELRLGYNRVRDFRDFGGTEFPRVIVLHGTRSVTGGTENFSGRNVLDQDAFEITNDLTIPWRAHSFTIGTNNEFSKFSNLFVRNPFGTYTFASFNDLVRGTPRQYEYSYLCQPGLPNCRGQGAERAEFGVNRHSLYAQDRWDARENLQLTMGLRMDATRLPDAPAENPDIVRLYGRSTANVPTSSVIFNPRLGFNWDVTGQQTTQIRGGVGFFSGRTPAVWVSNAYGNNGLDYVRFTCSTLGSNPTGTPNFVADPRNQPQSCRPGVAAAAAPNEINLIDPNFKAPQVARYSLAVDQQLPIGLIGTLEGLYTQTINDILYQNLRSQPDSLGRMVEGRPRYQTRTPAQTPGFGDVIDITNTGEGYAYNLTAQVQRPFRAGWEFSAAYTYSQARDVNPLTSSQAISNWRFNLTQDNPNNPGLGRSDFEIPHRIVSTASYRIPLFSRAATDLSVIYVGQSGNPFSFRYNDDINFDGSFGNDLLYVPATQAEVRFAPGTGALIGITPDDSWRNLNDFIERVDCLRDNRGQVLERNACRAPWSNRFDFRIAQNLSPIRAQNAQLTLDVLNVGNLLNSDWGRDQFVGNNVVSLLAIAPTNNLPDANGRRLYQAFQPRTDVFTTSNLGSRYQIQLGVRYSF